jgi:hypothetical protein
MILGTRYIGEFVSETRRQLQEGGYISPPESRGKLDDLAGEMRIRLFEDTARTMISSFGYWLWGVDEDVLPAFPAQAMVYIRTDAHEMVDWERNWPACGGKLYGGRMVALKWDPVWWNISAFRLPFPPFQIGSDYDVEDVDFNEATALGFQVPENLSVNVKVDLDVPDLTRRFADNLAAYQSKFKL